MRDTFKAKVFVETGTNQAETAVWASANFEHVFTVEAYEPLYQKAVETFGSRKNIQFLKGDSRAHIKSLTDSLTEPAIFWLDAHWCGENTFGKSDECPVVGELELLNASKVPHIVLIDDARFFLAPPPPPHEATYWPDISAILPVDGRPRFPPAWKILEEMSPLIPILNSRDLNIFAPAASAAGWVNGGSRVALQHFAHQALGMAAEVLRQNDFEGSLNQVSAAGL
jgi:hypothetical protein